MANDGDRARCMDAGMDDYMAKPPSAAKLRALLARYLWDSMVEGESGKEDASGSGLNANTA